MKSPDPLSTPGRGLVHRHEIVFWQSTLSPHMVGLAEAMVKRGHAVYFTAISQDGKLRRGDIGWPQLTESACSLRYIPTPAAAVGLARSFSSKAIHIFQGLRGRPVLERALAAVCAQGASPWCAMERVDERQASWPLKQLWYAYLLRRMARFEARYLAIGRGMQEWLIRRGAAPASVFPFAYFLTPQPDIKIAEVNKRIRVAYVGQLIRRKRVDLLMRAAGALGRRDFELTVIGDGPEASACRSLVDGVLPLEQQSWLGVQPMAVVRKLMATFDVLVLPSDHDGWGAVVSESLISGTPVICSDRCGAAAAVYDRAMGAVFRHGDVNDLQRLLAAAVEAGPVQPEQRQRVRSLAAVLTTNSGAAYLEALLDAAVQGTQPPRAPWLPAEIKGSNADGRDETN